MISTFHETKSRITTLLIKHPKMGDIYETVPTVDLLFLLSSKRTAFLSFSSEENTTLTPFLIPIRASRLRMILAN